MKYEIKTINECCISVSDGDHLPPPKADSGVPFITISNIDPVNNEIDFTDSMYVPREYYDSIHTSRKAMLGDILYSVVGSFGIPVLIKGAKEFAFQRHIAILRPNKEVVLPEYLYYIMKSRSFLAQADAYAIGAAQRTISLGSLRKMKVSIPSVPDQKRSISILAAIDRLIDINNKKISILEQMSENLYKEWFVRFRFPGNNTTELENGIPKGWKYIAFDKIYSYERGVSYSSEEIECDEGNNLINLKNIQGFGGFRRDGTKKYNGQYKSCQVVKYKDLIMGVTDMTQDRRTVGAVALVPNMKGIISADLIKLSSSINNVFSYCLFRWGKYSKFISQFGNGANVIHLKPGTIGNAKILIPTKEVIDTFVKKVDPIIDHIERLYAQNDNLKIQRDLLLPRLMSGKLEVK